MSNSKYNNHGNKIEIFSYQKIPLYFRYIMAIKNIYDEQDMPFLKKPKISLVEPDTTDNLLFRLNWVGDRIDFL